MKPGFGHIRRHQGGETARLTYLMMVVVCLILGLLVRLFYIQVIQHKNYLNLADSQQNFYAEIEPARGKILIQDKDGSLYPMAANKEFLVIYAVPSAITDEEKVANELYSFFKKPFVEKEVDDILKNQGATATSAQQISRDQMIEERKQVILANYRKILGKKNDPYEALEKRVDPDLAKQFHSALARDFDPGLNVAPADLTLAGGRFYNQKNNTEVKISGLGYNTENYRIYLENNAAAHLLGFTSFDRSERGGQLGKHGSYGLEGFFDKELLGRYGSVTSQRGAGGLMIAQDRDVVNKQDGDDLVLTIDRSVQFFTDKALAAGVAKYHAQSGSILVLRPSTGEVVAMSSWPEFNPNAYNLVKDASIYNNPIIFGAYEPGSVFKAVTMAAALDKKAVTPQTTYNDTGQTFITGWPKPISNSDYSTAGAHGRTNMITVLEKSLNVGAIFAMNSIGADTFSKYVVNFGFGQKTGIQLEGESAGNIAGLKARNIKPIDAATASFGQGISVTPLQMAAAYGVLANGGRLMKPYVVKEVRDISGAVLQKNEPTLVRQVISPESSSLISGMLANVVENGHSKAAKVSGYYLAGKTGTAQISDPVNGGYFKDKLNHTFVGYGPVDKPQFVVLVWLNNPQGFVYAESTAVPIAHDVFDFLLNYYQVPKTR